MSQTLEELAQAFADTFATTWNGKDGPAYGEVYWPDAELVDPTGTIWQGREAIVDMHVALWSGHDGERICSQRQGPKPDAGGR